MTNYFKVRSSRGIATDHFVFFDDEDPDATKEAYDEAHRRQRDHGGDISVYRELRTIPPGVEIIGRTR